LRLFASSSFALQFTLRFGAVGGLCTLVEASELLANGLALRFGCLACRVAMSWFANRLTLWAPLLLTLILRAADGTDGFFTVNSALGTSGFFTLHLAFRSLAHRMAQSGTRRVIALPFALRVTLFTGSEQRKKTGDEG